MKKSQPRCHYINKMDGLQRYILLVNIPLKVHQTGGIGGNNIFGTGFHGTIDFFSCHGNGNRFKVYRERSSKTAAYISVPHLTDLNPAYFLQ